MQKFKRYKDSTKRWELYHGDMQNVLKNIPENTYHSVVCVPPYHLTSIVKRFSGKNSKAASKKNNDGSFSRLSKGFMQSVWDGGDIAFQIKTWQRVYKVLKPGGYLLAFSSPRTYHRMACAVEDAGFEIVDQIMFLFGTGFPKGQNVSAIIEKLDGRQGVKTINTGKWKGGTGRGAGLSNFSKEGEKTKTVEYKFKTKDAIKWNGFKTALKTAHEPIVVARKPLSEKTYAANVLKHGTGVFNIDACRIGNSRGVPASPSISKGNVLSGSVDGSLRKLTGKEDCFNPNIGRYPANFIHDGSEVVEAEFAKYGIKKSGKPGIRRRPHQTNSMSGTLNLTNKIECGFGDGGSISRFFYGAKANKHDRAGSKHPTVKSQALMQYLTRLVTKPGGRILDPFAGSGSTIQAACVQGFRCTGVEITDEYIKDIRHRMKLCKEEVSKFKKQKRRKKNA